MKIANHVLVAVVLGLWAFILLAIVIGLASGVAPAVAHEWYDYQCCNKNDCRQTTLGEVQRHADGWYVVALKVTVPFEDARVRRSLDPLIHICLMPNWVNGVKDGNQTVRCLYIPEVAG